MKAERAYREAEAAALENELGSTFLEGSDEERERLVWDWIRNYREQGWLPRSKVPKR